MTQYIITPDRPDLALAYNNARDGDSIIMRGTHYLTGPSGYLIKGNKRVSIIGEGAVIDGSKMKPPTGAWAAWPSDRNATGFPLVIWGSQNLVLDGITIQNSPMGGCYVAGTNHALQIKRCVFRSNGWLNDEHGCGLALYTKGDSILIENSDAYGNHGGPHPQSWNADGFQVNIDGAGTIIRGNRSWRNADDGFDFFNVSSSGAMGLYEVYNNWAFENGYTIDDKPAGDGNGFKLGGRRSGSRAQHGGHTVHHCMSWSNGCNGFDENSSGAIRPMTLYNNTAHNNARRLDWGTSFIFLKAPHTLRNNLAVLDKQPNLKGVTQEGNTWNARGADVRSLAYDLATSPRKPDGSLPSLDFLRPKSLKTGALEPSTS